ncbi:MAG: hypothetical protein JO146_08605 [Candidatus Eremiobacteraeota bacterium]|nr:hypothetical protein [Candidatus Eremiobacteraeota bacterium]
MNRTRSISFLVAIALAPALSSCASHSIAPVTPLTTATQALSAAQTVQLPFKKYTLTGTWNGHWSGGGSSGKFSMHVTQKGNKFSGKVAITVKKQVIGAGIKGTIKKNTLHLSVSISQLGTGKGTATTNKTRTTMNGSITFTKLGAVSFSASKN